MYFIGSIIVAPQMDTQRITIKTGQRPYNVQLWAEIMQAHCGGSTVGVGHPEAEEDGFSFDCLANVQARIDYSWRDEAN